jgi:urocanate hydratase
MVIDGSEEAERRIQSMLFWDVNNGVARRAWARNPGALDAIKRAIQAFPNLTVTLPEMAEDGLIDSLF